MYGIPTSASALSSASISESTSPPTSMSTATSTPTPTSKTKNTSDEKTTFTTRTIQDFVVEGQPIDLPEGVARSKVFRAYEKPKPGAMGDKPKCWIMKPIREFEKLYERDKASGKISDTFTDAQFQQLLQNDRDLAIIEVSTQETFRLFHPGQPETQLVDLGNGRLAILSEEIDGFISMEERWYDRSIDKPRTRKEINQLLCQGFQDDIYGDQSNPAAFYGLGRVHVLSIFNQEDDLTDANFGTPKRSRLILKIDGGHGLSSINPFVQIFVGKRKHKFTADDLANLPFLTDYHPHQWHDLVEDGEYKAYENESAKYRFTAEFSQNPHYLREKHATMLALYLFPEKLFMEFVDSFSTGVKSDRRIFRKIKEKNTAQLQTLRDQADRIDQFWEYVLSSAATDDMNAYKKYLSTFTTPQKQRLLDKDPDGLDAIDAALTNLRNWIMADGRLNHPEAEVEAEQDEDASEDEENASAIPDQALSSALAGTSLAGGTLAPVAEEPEVAEEVGAAALAAQASNQLVQQSVSYTMPVAFMRPPLPSGVTAATMAASDEVKGSTNLQQNKPGPGC